MEPNQEKRFVHAALVWLAAVVVPSASAMAAERADWFHDARWGVMTHYLGAPPSSSGGKDLTAEMWNRQVDAFDVPGLADQVASTGAKYLLFTIGQNSGHYCAPNATYDRLVGISPSKCSRRDLVAELAVELKKRDVRLLVYLPSGAPAADVEARKKLGWLWGRSGGWQLPGEPVGGRLADFQRKWESIIREWSLRWGKDVAGWWIDGCYFADEMYRFDDEPNFASFAAALRAGNPDAIVAFNPGVRVPVIAYTKYEDYTAGEVNLPRLPEAVETLPGPLAGVRRGKGADPHLDLPGRVVVPGRPAPVVRREDRSAGPPNRRKRRRGHVRRAHPEKRADSPAVHRAASRHRQCDAVTDHPMLSANRPLRRHQPGD